MRVEIRLLGAFSVSVDGVAIPAATWRRRPAASLVKLLGLAPRTRLHRDRVIDALWPDLTVDAALPRLHKAAHFARQTIGSRDAVVLRDDLVLLFPLATVDVDAPAFEAAARAARTDPQTSTDACVAAAALYGGDLLPDDLDQPWTDEPRQRLRTRFEQVLRGAGRWPELLDLDPADEQAHLELLRAAVKAGDRTAALRRFDEMERVLAKELRVVPGPEAIALRDQVLGRPVGPAPVRPRPTSTETLLERDDELSALLRTARSVARTGRGSVVVVTGEAGSGKSSLVTAFLDRLDPGFTVAVGGCDDLLAPRSLGPFRDIAETLPTMAAALAVDGQSEALLPALLRFLGAAPTVLVLEDVHWADDATLDAIRFLSRRIGGIPAIVLLTFRDDETDAAHPLRRVLSGLGSASTRRVELGSLSVDAVRRLSGMDDEDATEIHRVTRGNPFFVTEVLAAGGDAVPATVRDAVLARVGRLPAAARRLAERLAVVPSRAERWLAEALTSDDPGAVAAAERSGVLSGGSEYVAFRHELARRAVEASLTVGELVQANREVLTILLAQASVEPSRIVHHAARAVRADLLIRYGPVAADDAERTGAHRSAVETLHLVLAHADALDAVTRATLLTRRAYSQYVINEYEAALADAEAAVAAAEACGDPVVLADALVVLSRITFFAHGPASARRAAQRATEILEPAAAAGATDPARLAVALIELARTHGNLATVGIVAQPSVDAVRYAERALAMCDHLERDDLRAQALWSLGSGRLALGDPRGRADIDLALTVGAMDTRLETRVRGYVNAAGSAYRDGRFDDARRYVGDGLRLAADGEFAAGVYRLHLTSAAVSASAGDWDDAVAELEELAASTGQPGVMSLLVRGLLARLLARRGDFEPATALLEQATAGPVGDHDSYVAGPLAVAEVELGWLAGTLDAVPPRARQALDLASESGHTALVGELAVYLRRACHPVTVETAVPEPWAAALNRQWRASAAAWGELGERYEQAVETALGGPGDARAAALEALRDLGATATVARLSSGSRS